jgi:hypothetical protein
VSLNDEDALAACDSGLSLCLQYCILRYVCRLRTCSFERVSRAVTAPCGVTVSTVGGCLPWSLQLARLLQTRSVLIATRKTNTIVTVIAEARFLNTVRLHKPYHGIGPGQRLPVVHFSPLDTSTLVARACLDIIALSLLLITSTAPHATPAIPISRQRQPGQNTPAGHGVNPSGVRQTAIMRRVFTILGALAI